MSRIFKVLAGITRNPTFLIALVFGLGFVLLWYFKQPTKPVETFVEPVVEVESIDNEAEYIACEEEARRIFSQEIDRIDQLEAEYKNSDKHKSLIDLLDQQIASQEKQIAYEEAQIEKMKANRLAGDYSVYPDYTKNIISMQNQLNKTYEQYGEYLTGIDNTYMDYREEASEELETEIDRCAVRFSSN